MATTPLVLVPPAGIRAAIEMHRAAWAAYQVAPAGEETEHAFLALQEMLEALLSTPCRFREDARTLAAHLRWYIATERDTRDWTQGPDSLALARASDLLLLLGEDTGSLPDPEPVSLGFLAARVIRRLAQAGELAAAFVLIVGGIAATGAASLIA